MRRSTGSAAKGSAKNNEPGTSDSARVVPVVQCRQDQLARFSSLVDLIQRAALDETLWREVVARISAEVGGTRGLLFSPTAAPADGGFWASPDIEASHMTPYVNYYMQRDLWRQRAGPLTEGDRPFAGEAFVPSRVFGASEIYNDFMRPMEIGRLLFTPVLNSRNEILPGGLHLSIYRPFSGNAFEGKDEELLRRLLPHLRTALQTRHALRQSEARLALNREAVEALTTGVLILDREARVLFCSENAERLILGSGAMTLKQGRLTAFAHPLATALMEFIAALFLPTTSGLPAPRSLKVGIAANKPPLLLQGHPLAHDSARWPQVPRPAAVLFIRDPQGEERRREEFAMRQFGLTAAEAWLASALVGGRPLRELAAERGVSRETLRTHLKSIFAKTGCRRQSEVVELVMSGLRS